MSGATASRDSKVKDENNLQMQMTDLIVVFYHFLNMLKRL